MKFWLDWQAHRKALVVFGILLGGLGFIGLLCILPRWAAAWVTFLGAGLFLYGFVYAVAKCNVDLEDSYR